MSYCPSWMPVMNREIPTPVRKIQTGWLEMKLRRMISNRESARRSRWRKKQHLENLTNQVNRLKFENRESKNRLDLVKYQSHVVKRENDQLRVESILLRQRLSGLYRILMSMEQQQLQY
ncbi:hypothetical protein Ancab_028805 [Ancistrocladus abbreviatus]